jgi:hypothetical protein
VPVLLTSLRHTIKSGVEEQVAREPTDASDAVATKGSRATCLSTAELPSPVAASLRTQSCLPESSPARHHSGLPFGTLREAPVRGCGRTSHYWSSESVTPLHAAFPNRVSIVG